MIRRARAAEVTQRYGDAPVMTKSVHIALADLKLERAWIVYSGGESYRVHDQVEVVPLARIAERRPLIVGSQRPKRGATSRRRETVAGRAVSK